MSQGSASLMGMMGNTTGTSGSVSDQVMGPIAGSSDQSMSTQATPVNVPRTGAEPDPTKNLKDNLGLMQKFTNLLGKTPEEREKNSKIFAALVKDLGNVGKSITDSTLMQRMMSEQSGGMAMLDQGGQGGMPAAIPRTDYGPGIMPSGGFK
jgi:hypothetical protein